MVKHPAGHTIKDGDVKLIANEGMPQYRNPYEKGNLYVQFTVTFPEDGFATPEQLAQLESILGPRPDVPMAQGVVDEVSLLPFDPSSMPGPGSSRGHGGNAYDEDDHHGGHGGPGVQCASQ